MKNKIDKNVRNSRLGSAIKRRLAEVLPEFLEGNSQIITVNKVEVSADSKYANVWISILGNDADKVLNNLHKKIYDIQGEVNKGIDLHHAPRITFVEDTSPAYAQKIEELIKDLNKE